MGWAQSAPHVSMLPKQSYSWISLQSAGLSLRQGSRIDRVSLVGCAHSNKDLAVGSTAAQGQLGHRAPVDIQAGNCSACVLACCHKGLQSLVPSSQLVPHGPSVAAYSGSAEDQQSRLQADPGWEASRFAALETFIYDFLSGSAGGEGVRLKLQTPLRISEALLDAATRQLEDELAVAQQVRLHHAYIVCPAAQRRFVCTSPREGVRLKLQSPLRISEALLDAATRQLEHELAAAQQVSLHHACIVCPAPRCAPCVPAPERGCASSCRTPCAFWRPCWTLPRASWSMRLPWPSRLATMPLQSSLSSRTRFAVLEVASYHSGHHLQVLCRSKV